MEGPLGELMEASPRAPTSRMNLHVGVLHYDPSCEYFPLLADPVHYNPDTQDINRDREEMGYWLGAMQEGLSTLVAKASASEHNKPGADVCLCVSLSVWLCVSGVACVCDHVILGASVRACMYMKACVDMLLLILMKIRVQPHVCFYEHGSTRIPKAARLSEIRS